MITLTEAQRAALAAACSAGVAAITYVTDPARWAAFAAFAEQHTGGTWADADRVAMRDDAMILNLLAEGFDSQ